jgi:hypothetical protein
MIYCTEAKIPQNPDAKFFTHYYNNGTLTASAGLFVFDAAFQNMPPFDKDENNPTDIRYDFVNPNNNRTFPRNYNLGLSQKYNTGEQAIWDTYTAFAPRRVRLSEDGRLFISLNTGTKSIVKELNPARLRYDYRKADGKLNNNGWFWDIFSGATWNTSQCRWEDASGKVIIAPNVGLDVRGSGSNLKLFAVSGDKGFGGNSDRESCHFGEFNLGAAKSWTAIPSKTNYFNFTKKDPSTGNNRTWTNCLGFSQWDRTATTATLVGDKNGDGINDGTPINAVVFYDYVNFEYDQYGGVWMCQHRANQTEAAAIAHINTSGKVDFTDHVVDRTRGAIRYTHDFSKLIVAGGQRSRKWIATNHTIKHQVHHGAVFNADKSQVELPCVDGLWATLYTVKHTSGTSKPVFTDSIYIKLDIRPMDFAWDYAGNLYAASASSEKLRAYALPNGGKPVVISNEEDELISHTRGYGKNDQRPEDYLDAFSQYVTSNMNEIAALKIICTRPKDLTRASLKNLKLALDREGFTTQQLNTAISELTNEEMAADIISLIRRYAIGSALISHEARIRRAVDKLKKAHKFTKQELSWIARMEKYLMEESVLNVGVFDEDSRFKSAGGFTKINKIFQNKLESIVLELNEYLYDDGGRTA